MADNCESSNPTTDETTDQNIDVKPDVVNNKSIPEMGSIFKDPSFLVAVQKKMNDMQGMSSGYIESLPKDVKRRIKALKKLQHKMHLIEGRFHEQLHELECQLSKDLEPLREQRFNVTTGVVEPTDSDCDWVSDDDNENVTKIESEGLQNKASNSTENQEEKSLGVPFFWLTILKNVPLLSEMIQEHDEAILECLTDIRVKMRDLSDPGFILEFHFKENDFFTNNVLTKDYTISIKPDEKDSLVYEGAEIIACKGCEIDWKKDKNVTVKVVRKLQKHKSHGSRRTVTKTVKRDSFFNFFEPPKQNENGEEEDEETDMLLASDYEVGHFIRERLVPRAVLYFTGEALEIEDDEEDEYEEDEKDDDCDDDNDPDFELKNKDGQSCKQQ